MVMYPNWRRKQVGGLGAPSQAPDTKAFWFILNIGLHKMRTHDAVPKYWNCSLGAPLHKSHKRGPMGKRVVHILPVPGKAFFARKFVYEPGHSDYGFVKGRRRESAIL
eukprot:2583944-Pyramimonas_sp.AAC.1